MVSRFFLFIILCFGNFFCVRGMELENDPSVIMAELSNGNLFPVQQVAQVLTKLQKLRTDDFFVLCELCEKSKNNDYVVHPRAADVLTKLNLTDPESGIINCVVRQIVSLSVDINRNKTAISVQSPVRHYVILGRYFRA